MNRFLAFIAFILASFFILTLDKYQSVPTPNERFDFNKLKKEHEQKILLEKELAEARAAAMKKKVEKKEVKKVLVELTTPQLERGYKLYAKCVVCHSKDGSGKKSQNAPQIGGQHDWYIESSILAMQSGERENKVMNPYIKKLTPQDVKDLAAYISKIPW